MYCISFLLFAKCNDEMDQASGRGKATVKNKQLKGHL